MCRFRCLLKSLFIFLLLSFPIQAQTFDKVMAHYESGNYVRAFHQFKDLAEQGNSKAMFMLGEMSSVGNIWPRDPVKAMEWYRMAADQGYAMAWVRLSDLLLAEVSLLRDALSIK